MAEVSFKERVKNIAIQGATLYKYNFIDFEYLICSKAFSTNNYYIAKSDKANYLHLIGINSNLSAESFFNKCLDGTLQEEDFDFIKPKQSEKSVKGSVRQKIKILLDMLNMYDKPLLAQENFKKNCIACTFAAATNSYTLGYAISGRPKSLMQKNELDISKSKNVDLIFRKKRGSEKFNELTFGDTNEIRNYFQYIEQHLDEDILKKL